MLKSFGILRIKDSKHSNKMMRETLVKKKLHAALYWR